MMYSSSSPAGTFVGYSTIEGTRQIPTVDRASFTMRRHQVPFRRRLVGGDGLLLRGRVSAAHALCCERLGNRSPLLENDITVSFCGRHEVGLEIMQQRRVGPDLS